MATRTGRLEQRRLRQLSAQLSAEAPELLALLRLFPAEPALPSGHLDRFPGPRPARRPLRLVACSALLAMLLAGLFVLAAVPGRATHGPWIWRTGRLSAQVTQLSSRHLPLR